MPLSPLGEDAQAQGAEEEFDPNAPREEGSQSVYDVDEPAAQPYPSTARGSDPFQEADPWAAHFDAPPRAEPAYVRQSNPGTYLRQDPPRIGGEDGDQEDLPLRGSLS